MSNRKICLLSNQGFSGWPQHFGDDAKTLATAEAQAVGLTRRVFGASPENTD
jgi:hypothetical protein